MKKIDFKWAKESQKDDDNPPQNTPGPHLPFEDEASMTTGAIGNVDQRYGEKFIWLIIDTPRMKYSL